MGAVRNDAVAVVRRVGQERTPIVIIDGFLDSCEVMLAETDNCSFAGKEISYYPGVRARLPLEYISSVLTHVCPIIRQVYKIPAAAIIKPSLAHYSLTTTPEEKLSLFQTVPHFDSDNETQFAILHYLTSGHFGGTGFFQHKTTKFERIGAHRLERYMEAFKHQFDRSGIFDRVYIRGSNQFYELMDWVDYQENRLIVYPGNLLHSGLINPETDIQDDLRHGRLTANIFVDFS